MVGANFFTLNEDISFSRIADTQLLLRISWRYEYTNVCKNYRLIMIFLFCCTIILLPDYAFFSKKNQQVKQKLKCQSFELNNISK